MTLLRDEPLRSDVPRVARRRLSAARGGRAREPARGGSRHMPVLAAELLELLDPQPGQTAIDCTFGDGGHARLLAERLGAAARCRDRPRSARRGTLCGARRRARCAVRFIRSGYAEALEQLIGEGLRADLAYFDLGMSSMQVDTRERGFSYSFQAPLDMRMDPAQATSAREIVADWDERRLAHALRDFGEERHANAIARAIVRRREQAPIETTMELVDTIISAIPAPARFAGGHPAKRVFQALRIAVNEELDQLDRALPLAWELLRKGGVLAGISFHSLEDRRVKQFLAELARGCICPPDLPVCACGREPQAALIARRSIVPSAEEVAANPRARRRGCAVLASWPRAGNGRPLGGSCGTSSTPASARGALRPRALPQRPRAAAACFRTRARGPGRAAASARAPRERAAKTGLLAEHDLAFHQTGEKLFDPIGRQLLTQQRVIFRVIGDDRDIGDVAFVAGPAMGDVAELQLMPPKSGYRAARDGAAAELNGRPAPRAPTAARRRRRPGH